MGPSYSVIGSLASSVRDLLDALEARTATIVGHSLGGGIAMQFLYQFPERCERLVREDDRMIPSDHGAAADLIPGCRFELVRGAGHYPVEDDPDLFAGLVADFMATTQPRTWRVRTGDEAR